MTITVRDTPKTHPATGVSYIYNALAFNTLLSSQETGAHHRGTLIPLRGNSPTLLRSILRVNRVSQIFPGRCRHRHPPAASSSPPRASRHARPPAWRAGWWLPGSRPAEFRRPVPSGQEELYGSRIPSSNPGFQLPQTVRYLRISCVTCGGVRNYGHLPTIATARTAHIPRRMRM
jgi:hypothetical protein